jgi:hypothetical protein
MTTFVKYELVGLVVTLVAIVTWHIVATLLFGGASWWLNVAVGAAIGWAVQQGTLRVIERKVKEEEEL